MTRCQLDSRTSRQAYADAIAAPALHMTPTIGANFKRPAPVRIPTRPCILRRVMRALGV